MTIEEKAKAYDKALKRAKAAVDIAADKDLVKGVATTIFPELRESEDEKIRKWLYDYIERVGRTWGKQPFHYERILAWIEKQKEPKNVSATTMAPSCWAEEPSLQKEQKQEWSEADEKLFWGFTAWVPNDELERLGVTRDDILKKLKSLRPLYDK